MDLMTLTEIRRAAQKGAVEARVHVQVESATPKLTREQQPYCELALADACDRMTLRVWSDHPTYKTCSAFRGGEFVELTAEFHQHSQFGLEARAPKWTIRPLIEQEKNELLQGPADLRARQNADWEFIAQTIKTIVDPRLRELCDAFLNEWGDRFRRTAAARNYHHARRGGLGRAHRPDDAHREGDRAALSAIECRSFAGRHSCFTTAGNFGKMLCPRPVSP